MNWTWSYAATVCERDYGAYVDWKEGFFSCPECSELIYETDWNDHEYWRVCPVCDFDFTEGE